MGTATRPARAEQRADGRPSKLPPLTAEQQELAAAYLPLAGKVAGGYAKRWTNHGPDFRSAASLALVESARRFDKSRGILFSTFLRHRLHGAMLDVQRSFILRGVDLLKNPATPQSLATFMEEYGTVLCSSSDATPAERLEARDYVASLLKSLPAKHAEICLAIYFDDMGVNEAAAALGYSKSRVSAIHKESLELLRDQVDYRERRDAHKLRKPERFRPAAPLELEPRC